MPIELQYQREIDDLRDTVKELSNALLRARPYVVRGYECAFPNQRENESVVEDIDDALLLANVIQS